jgi:K+-sensing histidine kinase KdpD
LGNTKNYDESQFTLLSDEVYKNSNCPSSMLLNILDSAMLNTKKINLQRQLTNLSQIVLERLAKYHSLYLDNKSLSFKLEVEPEIILDINPNYIKQVIDNLIINTISYSQQGPIKLSLRRKVSDIEFSITNEGIGRPKKEIDNIFAPIKVDSKIAEPACNRSVGLLFCKMAVEAHGGSIKAVSDGVNGTQFTFSLPI